jgi:hypothetical protein
VEVLSLSLRHQAAEPERAGEGEELVPGGGQAQQPVRISLLGDSRGELQVRAGPRQTGVLAEERLPVVERPELLAVSSRAVAHGRRGN